MKKTTLLINCPDRKGIIATVTNFILAKKGNTIYIEQHVDRELKEFFMRLECEFDEDEEKLALFKESFTTHVAENYNMHWEMYNAEKKPRMALFVSKYNHCLYDILGRYASGELKVHIPIIISNHEDLKPIADAFDIPFKYIPVTKDTKKQAETQQIELLKEYKIDFIVLARYMQIISSDFIDQFPYKIINIHRSFLPAFPGTKPYHSAYERGVKIIGATSHYVTPDPEGGPIIEQEIARVSHIHNADDFMLKGRDLEKIVLSRAIKHHLERKLLVYNNKTVVFS
ncbi:formyltetrahydrofolate deformylase [Aquimarina sp. EL_43]|uniref:formyltetrahydrofolate deformylase n=1 Tax=Aquimarina TaxID=290174 RepID=UPI000471A254|nr:MULTISPECIES: formyltetrahydrofolate deformylase [Aquimarina]MBG6132501.1 formyltetrahydrofolate deformylase [Aquimarina sp. EL_35]MBG6152632.1 formyltetrahydrofolate deformylase [Aquimarina sp. EL_32]MBG6170441.1 formyltetrahydrofolate deformylase [Aquimarina sp. EL_43]